MNKIIEIPKIAPNLVVWRYLVVEKDDYTCQHCSKSTHSRYLHAHHISKDPTLELVVSNGQTLCALCHTKQRDYSNTFYKFNK